MASKYRKTVWVIDIHEYLTYLEGCLDTLANKYPWLLDKTPVDRGWREYLPYAVEPNRTQRDFLLDWIIRQEMHEVFYLWASNHYHSSDYDEVHNTLVANFDIHTRAAHDIFIPNIYGYGDLHPGRIWRHYCWLYVECEVETTTLEKYAISPNATAGHPSKRSY